MDIGYSINSFHPSEVAPEAATAAVLERARAADAAGFDSVECGDHHVVSGGQYLQGIPMASRLAAEVDRVAPLALLPLYDPVLLAEQVATVAALADLDLWCGLGHEPASFEAFGVPMAERAPRFEECLDLLGRLWSGDDVTFEGEFYSVEGVSVNPKCDPRICVGGGAEPAVRRAGRLGDAWVASPTESAADVERKAAWFEAAGGGDLLVRRDALCLPDGDRARERADELLAGGYRGWGPDAPVLAGDADDVADALATLADVGVGEVVVRPMDGDHAVETLETVAAGRDRL
jgi:alkanesulfonate monooxygenase SsuD/methylene tetrahydromethanopterin reductase-like flavin-dependent oxidoreductase (luciferase family)